MDSRATDHLEPSRPHYWELANLTDQLKEAREHVLNLEHEWGVLARITNKNHEATHRELADLLGVSERTVANLMDRATKGSDQ